MNAATAPVFSRPATASAPGIVIWLTGLSGAGKTTLATQLVAQLRAQARPVCLLDGDLLRRGLCSDLGFSATDRRENIRRAGEVARLLADASVWVVAAFISPFRVDRAMVRHRLPAGHFCEVYVHAPLAVCEARDPKGLYKRARRGELKNFTGVDSRYEVPRNPDLHLDASSFDAATLAEQVLTLLDADGAVANGPWRMARANLTSSDRQHKR